MDCGELVLVNGLVSALIGSDGSFNTASSQVLKAETLRPQRSPCC